MDGGGKAFYTGGSEYTLTSICSQVKESNMTHGRAERVDQMTVGLMALRFRQCCYITYGQKFWRERTLADSSNYGI